MITTSLLESEAILSLGRHIVQEEAQALLKLTQQLDQSFVRTCELMLQCPGRVVVTGMGKSGHIANKIAATLASTGTPAFFVHPGEASHGDLGMITSKDVVLAISYSGETQEILTLLPTIRRLGAKLIGMTGRTDSTLSQQSHCTLNATITREACPLGLAPTTSTTVCLALGDALAIALLKMRGLTTEQFARSHPSGALGRKLLHVADIMHQGDALPQVHAHQSISHALLEITAKRFGMALVVAPSSGELEGIFTDGDLRRTLDRGVDIHATSVGEVMTSNYVTIAPTAFVDEALSLMRSKRILVLPVTDLDRRALGLLHMHDVLPTRNR